MSTGGLIIGDIPKEADIFLNTSSGKVCPFDHNDLEAKMLRTMGVFIYEKEYSGGNVWFKAGVMRARSFDRTMLARGKLFYIYPFGDTVLNPDRAALFTLGCIPENLYASINESGLVVARRGPDGLNELLSFVKPSKPDAVGEGEVNLPSNYMTGGLDSEQSRKFVVEALNSLKNPVGVIFDGQIHTSVVQRAFKRVEQVVFKAGQIATHSGFR